VTDTVSVPVELLQRLKTSYPATAALERTAIHALVNLIPSPPKVGDVLTAERVYDLPPRSTFVDSDDDVYVVYAPRKINRVTNEWAPDQFAVEEMLEEDAPHSDFNELRVTFIPSA